MPNRPAVGIAAVDSKQSYGHGCVSLDNQAYHSRKELVKVEGWHGNHRAGCVPKRNFHHLLSATSSCVIIFVQRFTKRTALSPRTEAVRVFHCHRRAIVARRGRCVHRHIHCFCDPSVLLCCCCCCCIALGCVFLPLSIYLFLQIFGSRISFRTTTIAAGIP